MPQCRSCGTPILWAKTPAGKAMPLTAEPSASGTIVLRDGTAHVLKGDELAQARKESRLYVSHFSDCPNAAQHRTKK